VFTVRYQLSFDILEDGILHSNSRENLKSYTEVRTVTVAAMIVVSSTNLLYMQTRLVSIPLKCTFSECNLTNYVKTPVELTLMEGGLPDCEGANGVHISHEEDAHCTSSSRLLPLEFFKTS
jgi:hypothetical protein